MNIRYKEFITSCSNIENYYNSLIEATKDHKYVGTTSEWIIDNYYLVVEAKNTMKLAFSEDKKLKKSLEENTKIIEIIYEIYERNNYNADIKLFLRELNSYQNKNNYYFSYKTINIIPVILYTIFVKKLEKLCLAKNIKDQNIKRVEELIEKLKEDQENGKKINLNKYLNDDLNIVRSPECLYYMNEKLKDLGDSFTNAFKQLNALLATNDIDVRKLINEEHITNVRDNILVTNIFNNLRNVTKLETSYLCEKISRIERLLLQDSIYKNMTEDTKILYRNQIVKRSKNKDEYKYALGIVEKSEKEGRHVGFYLLNRNNLRIRSYIYILLILIFASLISFLLSPLLFGSRILSFILLIIPVSEVVIQILNKVLSKIYFVEPLPKMDFSSGIPKEETTMVVIPTLVKDKKKVNEMFNQLEKLYLSNKTPNLYFSLLADCAQSDTQFIDVDEEIAKHGVLCAKRLNDKYDVNIFHFVYRKRQFNEKEGKYLGFERKRGALIHFNKLLLRSLSLTDKEKHVYVETISEIKVKFKYVIPLDTDTDLILNAAQKLVGLMAHPMNVPILNKTKTKVVRGYGMVQPRLSIDIEDTNESRYSQLMAGIGGFDVYSPMVPNFYQDVFKEGSFQGKGIYDLEVFDTVLSKAFPENIILSHDLIEGNYIRCAYASDIELVDGFPAEFLVDTSRQHRWARGDFQIIPWIKKKVKNSENRRVKNPLNTIEKFKIFDNLRRMFITPSLLLILILALIMPIYTPFVPVLIVFIVVSLPVIFYVSDILRIQQRKISTFKYYDDLTFGVDALLSRVLITFITIPYYASLYMNAMGKSFYRMFISHKNLLNWITAEDAAKNSDNSLFTYVKAFKFNYLISIIILVLTLMFRVKYIGASLIVAVAFVIAPFILHFVSKHNKKEIVELPGDQKADLEEMAHRTWLYFETLLIEENNYLIPDNFQVNREIKADTKTSPTDIGMSLTSIISAYELKFISINKAFFLLEKVIDSIEKLPKWHGHLYNWYDVVKMERLLPFTVSSVDSANLAASLIVVKEFAISNSTAGLANRIEKLFDAMDFSEFYTDKDVFSVVYNEHEDKMSIYNYNKFASESRILSFISIAKGDVPSKHWLCLDKSLTKYKNRKGLISWSGTSFEYFMPLIYMKTYPNTLMDESYFFAEFCQKEYMKEVDSSMPWGISESAYAELDDGLNYKYRAFSTPYLKVQEDKKQRVVLSPYASAIAITKTPKEVYSNLNKFKKIGMYSDFGFYESYDYDKKAKVLAYFAHHQGMILAAITNYLKDNTIQKYFHNDIRMKAKEILLKEKVELKPLIDMKIFGYKKYSYEKEKIENDIRALNYLSQVPEVSVISNSKYLTLINDRGNGFSRYGTIQLNRYRKITEQDYGIFMYVKDLNSKKVWSNTYSPMNTVPDKYNVVFASDMVKFSRTDGDVATSTEIIVTKSHDCEIRKVTFTNHSKETKELELTTYTESIIVKNIEDITHRTFKNLFVKSEYEPETGSVIMCRRNSSKKMSNYFVNRLLIEDNEEDITYETERAEFIGRNRNTSNPNALEREKLSNKAGTNIDPVISLRSKVTIEPNKSKTVYLIAGFAKSKEQIMNILGAYDTSTKISEEFSFTTIANNANTKLLGVCGKDMRLFNIMLNYLYQTSKHFVNNERKDILTKNSLSQSGLWKYGITGDLPIILIDIKSSEKLNLIREVLKAYEYYKSKSVFVDIVIVNKEEEQYKGVITRAVDNEKYNMKALHEFMNTPGEIYILDSKDVSDADLILLNMVARLRIDGERTDNLEEAIDVLQEENKMAPYDDIVREESNASEYDTKKLTFYNGFGGFAENGKEYVITNPDTPTPWSNIIANPNFGTIVTNNACGFTYAINSGMFKITSWTNDIVLNDKSEGIKINDKIIEMSTTKHGFGYSTFIHNDSSYDCTVDEFVAKEDSVKFYRGMLFNKENEDKKYKITFWVNPTFGPNEEKTSRYILTDYYEKYNAVLLRNVYSGDFSHITAFLSSDVAISSYSVDRILFKSIDIEVDVPALGEKEFTFMLGSAIGNDNVDALIKKYNSTNKVDKEFDNVKKYWLDRLSYIQVKTPDTSFNYVMNGWYLYQSLSSRINAKAGFYQVGGAFGYRDQLQDAINVCMIDSEIARKQIIKNAMHQFVEGDVLHWWHEQTKFGLRSRYKDDYLWLVYAICEYVRISGDTKFLDEQVPFIDGKPLESYEEERGVAYTYTEKTASIYEHALLAIEKALDSIGENGIPLMGGGDWNDGMNKIGIKGKGTSVWLGFFLYWILDKFKDVLKIQKDDSNKYKNFMEDLKESLNTTAWDGQYYLRAFFDNGDKLGSHENSECEIDLISQSFAILSSVAPKNRVNSVINAVEEKLVDKKLNIIKLLTPPFKESVNNPGYIMDYPEGIRENGGQYTHSTSWYIMALIKLGMVDRAFSYYQMINPINRTIDKEGVLKYKVEPYVIAADIYSNKDNPARGGWTWYTGSSAWHYNVGITSILGFNKEGNKLYIRPNVPYDWDSYEIEYQYEDTLYKMKINLKARKNNMVLDGEEIKKDYISLKNDKRIHALVINIKEK